jgi:hypothetical protein
MSDAERNLLEALRQMGPKPDDASKTSIKKGYSERLSAGLAQAFAADLRARGLTNTRPSGPGEVGGSGAERRIAGGIGAKKVDVTFATEESGLILALSIKTINFADGKTKNYQKNLTNRRGDMLFESVTLHRRFPYAVLGGFFFFDEGASKDGNTKRLSTFENAHQTLRLFTRRDAPAGRDEVFERLYIALHHASPEAPSAQFFEAGKPDRPVELSSIFEELIALIGERNFDMYAARNGRLKRRKVSSSQN